MITLPSLTLWGIVSWFRKSLIAQIVAGVIAFLSIWKINNVIVERKAFGKVVQASQKAGKKRNERTAKIRDRIDPDDAMRRLRREYSDNN